jgi:hypothetical protein
VLLSLVVALAIGCRQEVPPLFRRNQRPETNLIVVPEDSSTGFYRYHVYWNGRDPDGRVIRYLFAITDTLTRDEGDDWDPELAEDRDRGVYTTKTDSIFLFDAERGRLAFHVSAIDDFGFLDRSPARAFFFTRNRGLPRVRFLGVRPFRDDPMDTEGITPCDSAAPCSVQTFTNFKVRFTGATNNGRITGFQWRTALPGQSTGPMQPFGVDSLFLRAGVDTASVENGDTLWALSGNTVSVFFYNRYPPGAGLPSGSVTIDARVRDDARLVSSPMTGRRRVVVNHDPNTVMFKRIPACDCPNPPPDCASRDSIAAGWIAGIDMVMYPQSAWMPFCSGDTLPQFAHVALFAAGIDDQRDLPINPSTGLSDVQYRWRYTWCVNDDGTRTCDVSPPFSPARPAADYTLPPPDNRPWHGHRNGIGNTEFPGICPFDWTYFAAATDEWGRPDGTPDSITVYASGSPSIDSVRVASVAVLVPSCDPNRGGTCPDTTLYRYSSERLFGPDTVAVIGTWSQEFLTPCALGRNAFSLPFRAYGHDHPRDNNPDIRPDARGLRGAIRAWSWRLNCEDCEGVPPRGGSGWQDDVLATGEPPDRQVFDAVGTSDPLRFTLELDTLLLSQGMPCVDVRAVLGESNFGHYIFQVRGRDTAALTGTCTYPTLMDSVTQARTRSTAGLGRTTELITREVHIVQYADVRPVRPAAKPREAQYGARVPRKRWFR